MANIIDQRLKELNIELDDASVPAGSYVPYVITNNLVFISGQLPFINGQLTIKGKVGDNVSLDDAVKMSEACAKALLSQLKAACNGNLDKVNKVVKLGGFVASAPNFTDQPKVINGASDLIVNIFGDKGKHSRFAVGVAALPLNVPVE
ncbi:MAG: RidA family protein, partial [Alphaproteobacteria bacterium]|nr:RidA family protein [Alphaproteobacteria bacterium]